MEGTGNEQRARPPFFLLLPFGEKSHLFPWLGLRCAVRTPSVLSTARASSNATPILTSDIAPKTLLEALSRLTQGKKIPLT